MLIVTSAQSIIGKVEAAGKKLEIRVLASTYTEESVARARARGVGCAPNWELVMAIMCCDPFRLTKQKRQFCGKRNIP